MKNNLKPILIIILVLALALSAFCLVKYCITKNADKSNLMIVTDPETNKDITLDLSKPEERKRYCELRGKMLNASLYQQDDPAKKLEAAEFLRVLYLYDNFSKEEMDLIAQTMVNDENTSYYEVLEKSGVDTEEKRLDALKLMITGKNAPNNSETSHHWAYMRPEEDFDLFVKKLFNDDSLTYRAVLSKYNIVDESLK